VTNREPPVGCYVAERCADPDAEYWCSSDSQELLLSKPPHETLFIDGKEQVEASFQLLRPVDAAYRCYLPEATRLHWVSVIYGYRFLVLPAPVVAAERDLVPQIQAAVRAAGPIWLADDDLSACRKLFADDSGCSLKRIALPLDKAAQLCGCPRHGKLHLIEVRYDPCRARRCLQARQHASKRGAVSVKELGYLISDLAREARSAGYLTAYAPLSSPRVGKRLLIQHLNTVLAVHQAICGPGAYRRNPQYVSFMRRAAATRQATLRKFADEGFCAWLERELRSRTVRRLLDKSAKKVGNRCQRWQWKGLPLPFDRARAAEQARRQRATAAQPSQR
jgi:hypothetical protein